MKIKEGGETSSLLFSIAEIRVGIASHGAIELWIEDKDGNESLSYLTLDEAMQLAHEVKMVLIDKINQI